MGGLETLVLSSNKGLNIPAPLERDWGRPPPALCHYRRLSRLELGPYMLGGGAPWTEALLTRYAGRNTAPNLLTRYAGWRRERRSGIDWPCWNGSLSEVL